jgi:hypothetical protein
MGFLKGIRFSRKKRILHIWVREVKVLSGFSEEFLKCDNIRAAGKSGEAPKFVARLGQIGK